MALQCVELFPEPRTPHYPGSVYAKFPDTVLPKLLDVMSLESLEKALNQLTMEVSAEIPLPEGIGAKSKKIEMDIDVEQLGLNNGSLISRLSTTLKEPQKNSGRVQSEPINFHEHNPDANSTLALHMDMINASIKASMADLQKEPLQFESDGIQIKLTKAPVLKSANAGDKSSEISIEATVTIPRESIMMSGIAFKHDIVANATIKAEFVLDHNNNVSLKIISVNREKFSFDAETMRFSENSLTGKTFNWFINKITTQQIEKFNRQSLSSPVVVENLFKIPQQIAGLNIQMVKMYIDQDGYLKVELNVNPQSTKESNIKVRIKGREN